MKTEAIAESEVVEPYQYEPLASEGSSSIGDDDDDSQDEGRLLNTDW